MANAIIGKTPGGCQAIKNNKIHTFDISSQKTGINLWTISKKKKKELSGLIGPTTGIDVVMIKAN